MPVVVCIRPTGDTSTICGPSCIVSKVDAMSFAIACSGAVETTKSAAQVTIMLRGSCIPFPVTLGFKVLNQIHCVNFGIGAHRMWVPHNWSHSLLNLNHS